MLDIITSKARPTAASQAENTNRRMGIMKDIVECRFIMVRVLKTNIDNIMPSRHSREDIRWERNTSIPVKAVVKARVMLVEIEGM